ncbi:Phosphoesterase family protein [hydrothermal vent metagenome]|uniref:Phosphoesterase family protein n=1 Tax=hydrothermal vent metagenome TaxID=652676 RepID=A0A3B1E588_9ZZZZ
MKIAFIGDIVGRPGRKIIKHNLSNLRNKYDLDFVVANGENASHGFGLTVDNANELFKCGIDLITGGNHSWDKQKDILALFKTSLVLRPDNYPKEVPGSGLKIIDVNGIKLAIVNLMGMMSMPQVINPFTHVLPLIEKLKKDGVKHICLDFHAEATAEKRIMMQLLKSKVSAICGTHTHIGTDDLEITDGTFYVTDIGLTGCRDNVIGMDNKVPIQKALTGLGGHFSVPNDCKSIMQIVIINLDEDGQCYDGLKIKLYNDKDDIISHSIFN